jgi:hypothetical protein
MVRKIDDVRSRAADWRVLVVLEAPGDADLAPAIDAIYDAIVEKSRSFHSETIRNWFDRLKLVKRSLNLGLSTSSRRRRRGLLDIGGKLLHGLFGVATDQDIEECRQLIAQAGESNLRIVHTVNRLVSVLNKTQKHVVENRAHINAIQRYVANLSSTVAREMAHWTVHVQSIRVELKIEQTVRALEQFTDAYLREWVDYRNQKADLEAGGLTESILPPHHLRDILGHAEETGLVVQNYQWYYENVRVEPFWEDSRGLVYQFLIPLSDHGMFIQYSLESWPVPINKSYCVTIKVNPVVVMDSSTGSIFLPQWCIGIKPALCRTGAIYKSSGDGLQCERGVITGSEPARKLCQIFVGKQNGTLIYEWSPGKYVISTRGERTSYRCEGAREVAFEIKRGTYSLTLEERCTVEGKGWFIKGMMNRNFNITVRHTDIPIPPMNLSAWIPTTHLSKLYDNAKWESLAEIQEMSVSKVDSDQYDLRWPGVSVVGGHVSWANVVLVGGLIIVVILIGRAFVKHRSAVQDKFSKLFSPIVNSPSKTESPDEVPPSPVKRVYPDLSPESVTWKSLVENPASEIVD